MSKRNLFLASTVLLAGALLVWAALHSLAPAPVATLLPASPARTAEHAPEPIVVDRSAVEESRVETADSTRAVSITRLRGRAVDLAGAPIPELTVGVYGEDGAPPPMARTGLDGTFSLDVASLPCLVEALDPGWTTVCYGEGSGDDPLEEAVVVAARVAPLAGAVVDAAQRPLGGANLELRLAPEQAGLITAIGPICDWTASSADDGRFLFPSAPVLPRATLRTTLSGWRPDEQYVELPLTGELRIVLVPDEPTGPILEGTVVHQDGAPAGGALVSFGSARDRADASGAFRLACAWFDAATPLVAALPGYQPAVVAAFGARADPLARALPPERIVIPGRELSIEGRVLGADGAALKGWRIALADATELDPGGSSRDVAESLIGGRAETRADGEGRFRLGGLAARPYTLLAYGGGDRSRASIAIRSESVPAGSREVELRVTDTPRGTIRGRVWSASSPAVEAARIGIGRPAVSGSSALFAYQGRATARTGAQGRFELGEVPAGHFYLVVTGESIVPARVEIRPGDPRNDVEIRVDAARRLQFDGSAASPLPDGIRAFSRDGTMARLWDLDSAVPQPTGLARLDQGRSEPLAVGSDAVEIRVYRGCVELGRVALSSGTDALGPLAWP